MGRSFSYDSISVFESLLRREDWDKLLSSKEMDAKFEAFVSVVRYNFEVDFPMSKIKIKSNNFLEKYVHARIKKNI